MSSIDWFQDYRDRLNALMARAVTPAEHEALFQSYIDWVQDNQDRLNALMGRPIPPAEHDALLQVVQLQQQVSQLVSEHQQSGLRDLHQQL